MTPEERRTFLETHRLAVVGLPRAGRQPHLTPVYYVLDGGDILISTTAARYKGRAVRRDARVTVCVLGEAPPFPYLTVYGHGRIEEEHVVDVMMRVGERMTGSPVPESARPAVEQRAQQEGRVVLRVTPEAYTP